MFDKGLPYDDVNVVTEELKKMVTLFTLSCNYLHTGLFPPIIVSVNIATRPYYPFHSIQYSVIQYSILFDSRVLLMIDCQHTIIIIKKIVNIR